MSDSSHKAPKGALSSSTSGFSSRSVSLAILAICLLLSVPVLTVLSSVFSDSEGVWQHLYETVLGDYVLHSLLLMLGVGVTVLFLGIGPAWLVTMTRFPGSRYLEWALVLPLAMPAYIIAYTYTGLLDVGGPVQAWIRDTFSLRFGDYWFPQIRSLGGAITMLAFVLYPYVYLLSRTAFLEQSICVLEVSRTLGASPFKAFTRVAVPLARPAIIAGLSLVLMETLADYGTVQYFGISAFTTGVYRTWFGLGSQSAAAQLAAVLTIFVLFLLIVEYWSRNKARYHHTSNKYTRLKPIELVGWKRYAALLYCLLPVLVGFLIPFVQLTFWAFDTWDIIDKEDFFALVFNSLELASITAVIALFVGLFISYSKRLKPSLMMRSLVRILGLGYAIPGTVIAVGVLIPFAWFDNTLDAFMRENFDIATGLLFSGTLIAVVFAYLVRFLPVSLNTLDAGLGKIKPTMDDVGRSMGLSPLRILRRVHMPIMKGSLLTASLLVFVDVLKELPATLILRPFNFNTLAIRTYELANQERLAEAASSALMIVLAGIIPVIILSRTISRSRPGYESDT
ncbi:MAG: iron ABC transporter permease [Pseudohongiellaceae bacterium]|nr:iron ABC transporter permease [Pseudohongiellaceae bacterium]